MRLLKGGSDTAGGLFSNSELQAKEKEWNQTNLGASQKQRWEIYGRSGDAHEAYGQLMRTKQKRAQVEETAYRSAPAQESQAQSFSFGAARQQYYSIPAPYYGMENGEEGEEMGFGYLDDENAPKSLEFEEEAWEESGMTTTYEVPAFKTLAPSWSLGKHKIAKIDFKSIIFSHIVIGKLRQVAFLKARFTQRQQDHSAQRVSRLDGRWLVHGSDYLPEMLKR